MINELLRQIEHGYDEEGSILICITLSYIVDIISNNFNEDTFSSV